LNDEGKIKKGLEIAEKELEQAKVEGFHDRVFVNADLLTTYEQLERYIFGAEDDEADPSASTQTASLEVINADIEMADGDMTAGEEVARGAVEASAEESQDSTTAPTEENTSAIEGEEPTK
jgi:THO complex subunit 1